MRRQKPLDSRSTPWPRAVLAEHQVEPSWPHPLRSYRPGARLIWTVRHKTMTLVKFILLFLVSGYAFTWIFPLLMAPFLGLAKVASNAAGEDAPLRPWMIPLLVVMFVATLYFICAWSAYAAWVSHTWSARPAVSQHWLHYIIGFFGFISPLTYMASHDRGETGSGLHILLATIAFVVFCTWPVLIELPYGWIASVFGITHY